MSRIAVLGLSGVGKSTLLRGLAQHVAFTHLQAGELIKIEQAFRAELPQSSEELRIGPVLDNQALLVAGFLRVAAQTELPIIFDGHSVIDGRDGLIEIPTEVFRALNLNAICFLHAAPSDIAIRRLRDLSRQRPCRHEQELDEHQQIAIAAARRIANELGCPFHLVTSDDHDMIVHMISSAAGLSF